MVGVNLTAPFLLGQRFGPAMASRGWGRIINVTSQQAQRAFGNSGGYGASKGGLAALTRSQSEAWAADGVCVNVVLPGRIGTDRIRALDEARANRESRPLDTVVAQSIATIPVGRYGMPEEYGDTVAFLASARASFINGSVIRVDGGMIPSI